MSQTVEHSYHPLKITADISGIEQLRTGNSADRAKYSFMKSTLIPAVVKHMEDTF